MEYNQTSLKILFRSAMSQRNLIENFTPDNARGNWYTKLTNDVLLTTIYISNWDFKNRRKFSPQLKIYLELMFFQIMVSKINRLQMNKLRLFDTQIINSVYNSIKICKCSLQFCNLQICIPKTTVWNSIFHTYMSTSI